MTQRNLFELIRQDHPQYGDVYLRVLTNSIIQEAAYESMAIRNTDTVSTDGSALRFTLPTDCVRLEEVYDNDTGSEIVHAGVHSFKYLASDVVAWWVENGEVVIGYHSVTDKQFKPLESGLTYELRYRAYPSAITSATLDAELPFPAFFHAGIEARLQERLNVGDQEKQRYYHAVWRDFLRKLKRYANEQQDGGAYNVLLHSL